MEKAESAEDVPKGRGKLGLIVAALGTLLAAGGGFALTYLGVVQGLMAERSTPAPVGPTTAFVALDQITVSLHGDAGARFLRLSAQIEAPLHAQAEVQRLQPRLVSVMNTYLPALDAASLQEPAAIMRVRAQLLRRLQLVAGEDAIADVLITEFILG